MVITMSSAAGLAAHIARGAIVPVASALPLVLAARQTSSYHLQRSFAVFVALVGCALIVVNIPAALRAIGGLHD